MQYAVKPLPQYSLVGLFLFFFKSHRILTITFILLCVFWGAVPSIDSILLKNIINLIDTTADFDVSNLPTAMLFWAILYGLWWESLNIIGRVYDYIYLITLPVIKGKVIDEVYNHIQYHDQNFFQENLAGQITNRVTEASRSCEMIFYIFSEQIVRKFAIMIFAILAIYSVHYKVAIVFFVWVIVFITLSMYFSKTIHGYSYNYAKQQGRLAGKIVDTISNISVVRMFTSHKFERRYINRYITKAIRSDQDMQCFMLKLRHVLGMSCSIMICITVYLLSVLRSNQEISTGDCVLVLSLCVAVVDQIWELSHEIGDLFEEIGAFAQSMSLIQPHVVADKANAGTLHVSNGVIEFTDVTFYHKNNRIFYNKSILIEAKQKVGLVGFSGAGKTTFVNLITRIYDINGGAILIDGQNIQDVTQNSLRQNISIIPQEPVLFHRTIMDNIRYGKQDATDDEVIAVANAAHIHDFIGNLPDGYNTLCGERGSNLSGGQRQRIMIARAILKNAPILILDEATSSLDTATEGLIQESLKHLMCNKTVIVIAHRLSTLHDMDKIFVFDKGVIVEQGTHKKLIEQGTLYKKLWQSQVCGMIA